MHTHVQCAHISQGNGTELLDTGKKKKKKDTRMHMYIQHMNGCRECMHAQIHSQEDGSKKRFDSKNVILYFIMTSN